VIDHEPDDYTLVEAAKADFSAAFVKSFVLTFMSAVVILRLVVGVRQRLAQERNVIDADADPSSR